jgi:glycosyltransferase involved in cell wall biosynthesis
VQYGAINVYLQEKSSWYRRLAPRALESVLDSPRLLKYVSRFGAATTAKDLGALTLSILRGEEGHQNRELSKLLGWLAKGPKPDLVQLTNSMFLGLARGIKQRLGVPILCTLQGEDIFLDELPEPYRSRTRDLLKSKAADVDGFVATSTAYADFMSGYLGVDRERIHVVPLGINLSGHGSLPRISNGNTTIIGYLARICPEKGLHLLVEAFDLLLHREEKRQIRLEVAGYLGPRDRAYFEEVVQKVERLGWTDQFRYRGEVDRQQKLEFLASLDLLSVPTIYKDPKGLFVLEALANEVPVVQPSHGSFPELIEQTGGGRLVEPDSASALADGLFYLLENPEERTQLGKQGKAAVHEHYSDDALAERALAVYRKYVPSSEI